MDITRIGAAIALSIGIPVLAMVQPGSGSVEATRDTQGSVSVSSPPALSETPFESATAAASPRDPATAAFGAEITRLSDEADGVDRLWLGYKADCLGRTEIPTDRFGREWFSILDVPAPDQADSTECGELQRLIQATGMGIRTDLKRAVSRARRAHVEPATEVGLVRWHTLELP